MLPFPVPNRGEGAPCHVIVYTLTGGKPTTTSCLDLDERFDKTCSDDMKQDLHEVVSEVDTLEETSYVIAGTGVIHLILAIVNALIYRATRQLRSYRPAPSTEIAGTYDGKTILAL